MRSSAILRAGHWVNDMRRRILALLMALVMVFVLAASAAMIRKRSLRERPQTALLLQRLPKIRKRTKKRKKSPRPKTRRIIPFISNTRALRYG